MEISTDKYKTDSEIQQEIHAFFDAEAQRVIDCYLEEHPEHDISEHEDFTRVGISSFFLDWYCNRDRIKMTKDLYEKIIKMYLKLIPRDWHFLENLESELRKTNQH